jgi:putative flippase GtrA
MTLLKQIGKFVGVGGLATALHAVVALLVDALIAPSPLMSNFCGYLAAVLFSYVGHTRITFSVDTKHGYHFPRFCVVSVVGLMMTSAVTWVATDSFGLSFPMAMLLVVALVPAFTFVSLKLWALV